MARWPGERVSVDGYEASTHINEFMSNHKGNLCVSKRNKCFVYKPMSNFGNQQQ